VAAVRFAAAASRPRRVVYLEILVRDSDVIFRTINHSGRNRFQVGSKAARKRQTEASKKCHARVHVGYISPFEPQAGRDLRGGQRASPSSALAPPAALFQLGRRLLGSRPLARAGPWGSAFRVDRYSTGSLSGSRRKSLRELV